MDKPKNEGKEGKIFDALSLSAVLFPWKERVLQLYQRCTCANAYLQTSFTKPHIYCDALFLAAVLQSLT